MAVSVRSFEALGKHYCKWAPFYTPIAEAVFVVNGKGRTNDTCYSVDPHEESTKMEIG